MARKKQKVGQRNVALCYIRQSYTRDEDDMNSPDRQRANIQAEVERRGWVAEWYEDVGGHKSGRYEDSRPGWLALKARLGDADVVALVANDMSRLHRKGWRIGELVDILEANEVDFVTTSGRKLDTSTPAGKMQIQFYALFDEMYAEDIAQRQRDSVRYRKKRGVTVGLPPFGTIRNSEGYLIPSIEGGWLLSSGKFERGENQQTPPTSEAVWRSYYECASKILELYAQGNNGLERIAYQLNEQGWAFRNRHGKPRRITRDDVRRVVANWQEYGGVVLATRSKDRPAYVGFDYEDIQFHPERAVFPLELLVLVGQTRQKRSIKPSFNGVQRNSRAYPLSSITYCHHCQQLAYQYDDLDYRSTLSGHRAPNGVLRYRHKSGINCGITNRSIHCETLENDMGRLIQLFDIDVENITMMTQQAIELDKSLGVHDDLEDLEQRKYTEIAMCQRRIDAAIDLYKQGFMPKEEFDQTITENRQSIAHWEAKSPEEEKIRLQLEQCAGYIQNMARLWNICDEKDRKGMVNNLFEYVVVDLDTQRITEYALKPWADRFLVLRMGLYEDILDNKKALNNDVQGLCKAMPPRGLEYPSVPHTLTRLEQIIYLLENRNKMSIYIKGKVYSRLSYNVYNAYDPRGNRSQRNTQILAFYKDGVSITTIANHFSLSPQRIHQIVHFRD